jgi:outer membrane biosynthesis protein TonB
MIDRLKKYLKDENRFGAAVTGVLHLLLLIFAILYHIHMDVDTRPAYIEVTLGEFQTGTVAEYAEQQQEEVATRPDPPPVEPDEPDPEIPEPEETPQPEAEETAKPVDLADQIEEIDAEVLETPDTDQINPEVVQQQQEEVVESPPRIAEADQIREGEEESGHVDGTRGCATGSSRNPDWDREGTAGRHNSRQSTAILSKANSGG